MSQVGGVVVHFNQTVNIAEGCIGITWLIPVNLIERVIKMVQETANMLAEENILKVMLEGQCTYPMESKVKAE